MPCVLGFGAHCGRSFALDQRIGVGLSACRENQRMRRIDTAAQDRERVLRGKIFRTTFVVFTLTISTFLLWKLRALLLPIVVGALLAYLFRPVKDRFRIP